MNIEISNLRNAMQGIHKKLSAVRENHGKTIKEVSNLLGVSTKKLRKYESGALLPSLPEIEALAFIFETPLSKLLNAEEIIETKHNPDLEKLTQLIQIRHKIIGTSLQIAHSNAKITYKAISQETSIPISRIQRYEKGNTPIPLNELIKLGDALNFNLRELQDQDSPIGKWQKQQKRIQSFLNMPEKAQGFASQPDNLPYLQLAIKIKEAGLKNIKDLIDGLQELTNTKNNKQNSAPTTPDT